jgi:hypothetical protein
MTEIEETIIMLAKVISELPKEQKKEVDACLAEMTAITNRYGPLVFSIAVAMTGLQVQKKMEETK